MGTLFIVYGNLDEPDGFQARIAGQMDCLLAQGEEIRLLHLNVGRGQTAKADMLPHVPSREVSVASLGVPRALVSGRGVLRRMLETWIPDRVVMVGFPSLFYTDRLRRLSAKAQLVFDMHGVAEERLAGRVTPRQALTFRVFEWLQARYLPKLDRLWVVSERLRDYCREKYGVPADRVRVIPCGTEVGRFRVPVSRVEALREELGLSGRPVAVYCGSAGPWQCAEESVRLFQAFKQLEPSALLLILTPCPGEFRRLAERHGLPPWDCRIIPVSPSRVPDHLALGDIGLLLRHRSIVNAVASPVKFAEYLAAGVPVLIGPDVGDYSRLVEEEGVGVVIDPGDEAAWPMALRRMVTLLADREFVRERCRRIAQRLSWSAVLGSRLGDRDF